MASDAELEDLKALLVAAYADLWAHHRALVGALGMTAVLNDGRLEVDAQLLFERQLGQFTTEAERRLRVLAGGVEAAKREGG
jgi:hypothetical protein